MSAELDTPSDPFIHLIRGSTGAGKSTYARMLSNDIGAIHFSVDDWMTSLFGPDLENPMDWKWISERTLRCENRMISTGCALAETGEKFRLEVTRDMFDFFEALWESPSESELISFLQVKAVSGTNT